MSRAGYVAADAVAASGSGLGRLVIMSKANGKKRERKREKKRERKRGRETVTVCDNAQTRQH